MQGFLLKVKNKSSALRNELTKYLAPTQAGFEMVTSLERRIQEFSLRMGQQTDPYSQEIQVESHPTDKETSRNRRQTYMILTSDHRQQTDSFSQEIQVESHATDEETSRKRRQKGMKMTRDSRPSPSARKSMQQMKIQAETGETQI
jgi:hypothetical protein